MDNRNSKIENTSIKSFRDLRVYQNLYKAMQLTLIKIIPKLPNEERYDLVDQMRRASKAGPALIAEGFAKRYQLRAWKKYLNDTIGECNEMIHHLAVCIDIYGNLMDIAVCREVIDLYDHSCRQLTKLAESWKDYHDKNGRSSPNF